MCVCGVDVELFTIAANTYCSQTGTSEEAVPVHICVCDCENMYLAV